MEFCGAKTQIQHMRNSDTKQPSVRSRDLTHRKIIPKENGRSGNRCHAKVINNTEKKTSTKRAIGGETKARNTQGKLEAWHKKR